MAVCAGPAGGAARLVSRVCRRTSPEDGRTTRIGHEGDVTGGYRSPLALGMTLGVRIVIYGARRRRGLRSTSTASAERNDVRRNPPKSPAADSIAESIRWTRVIHASPLIYLRLRLCQRASSSFHVGTRTEGIYEKRLPAGSKACSKYIGRRCLRPWTRRKSYCSMVVKIPAGGTHQKKG
ncbi:hypothetical protein B0H14DRAFT_2871168 [Mycena olivaceomarginata]|nr:hypothetical protein B0H14DRAFT_2871168 [Mycena olivaceomarginata]